MEKKSKQKVVEWYNILYKLDAYITYGGQGVASLMTICPVDLLRDDQRIGGRRSPACGAGD